MVGPPGPAFGLPITYTEAGIIYPALVIGVKVRDGYIGSGGEPMVDLVFVKPVNGIGPDGTTLVPEDLSGTAQKDQLVQFRQDVIHETATPVAPTCFWDALPGPA